MTSTSNSTSELLGAVGGSSAGVHHHYHHHHHHHHPPRTSSPRPARHPLSPGPSPSRSSTSRRQSIGLPPIHTFPPRRSPRRVSQPRFPGLSPIRTQLQGLPTYEEAIAQGASAVPAGTSPSRTLRRHRDTPYRRVENTDVGVSPRRQVENPDARGSPCHQVEHPEATDSPRRQSRNTVAVTVLDRTTVFELPEVPSTPARLRR